MATNTSHEEPLRCGENTMEYRRVQASFDSIVKSLESNRDAFKSLCRKIKEKTWNTKLDVTPDDLLNVVLDRIRLNVQTYREFLEILRNVDGLDLIKEAIEGTNFPVEETREESSVSVEPDSYPVCHDSGVEKQSTRKFGTNTHPGRTGNGKKSEGKSGQRVMTDSGLDTESDTEVRSHRKKEKKRMSKQAAAAPLAHIQPALTEDISGPDFEEFPPNEPDVVANVNLEASQIAQSADVQSSAMGSPPVMITGHVGDRQQEDMLADKMRLEYELKSKEEELKALKSIVLEKDKTIEKYETQIKELQQLQETNVDLQRELEKERAAKQKAEVAKGELEVLKRIVLKRDITTEELEKQIKELQKTNMDLQRELEKEKAAKEKAELEHTTLKSEISELREELNTLKKKQEQSDECSRRREQRRASDKADMEEKLQGVIAEQQRRASDKGEMEEKVCKLQEEFQQMEEKRAQEGEARHAEIMNALSKQMQNSNINDN